MIFYNIKNKNTGKIVVFNQNAKELLERDPANLKQFEILGECDQNGREFNYNNFLTKANESKSIDIGTKERIGEQTTEKAGSNGNKKGPKAKVNTDKNGIESGKG